ncbi:MAG TPA: tRNA preQ1(34) S-adenosylmethionine ribosyltransferase-isomerase QueA [Vicinamibacterales bacterium]|nr:tRNA preQ1(34) S-adenosylmethionine ribosyltransferase-isomerase QueA [Vicinamibacterales bacterium]
MPGKTVLVSDFDYELPDELVAQEAAPRGASRLLVLDRVTGKTTHTVFSDLVSYLRPGDLLVVNDTRVFPARLLGRRAPSGGAVECLLLERIERPATADAGQPGQYWMALVHPGQKLKPGARMRFEGTAGALLAGILERRFHGRRSIRLWAESGSGTVEDLIDALGHVPLPPYIRRVDTEADRERYQTVYASRRGSIAAPTAGLHFTPELLESLARHGVQRVNVTLHVGYGTFKPVRSDVVEEHVVDPECYDIGEAAAHAIDAARSEGRRVVAVGTTTTRALEDSAARHGGRVVAGQETATLFIHPGFRFQVVDGLLTNFHLPRSSLLMLVAAFAGRERVLAAYREAVELRYGFYSYGDAMLVV